MREAGAWRDEPSPEAPWAVVLIRLLVGFVFFEEGMQKLLFPAVMGAGRFARIGIPAPNVMGPFVGVIEIACGALLVLGLVTRLATLPLLLDITANPGPPPHPDAAVRTPHARARSRLP